MNNKFSEFVKKTKIKVIFRLIIILLIISTIAFLIYKFNLFIVIQFILIIFLIIISLNKKKEEKKIIKYNLGIDIDPNIYVPLVFDIEYLNKLSNELNENIKLSNNINNLVTYVQYMIDNNQMIFVEKNFKIDTITNLINTHMKNKNIHFKIDKDDIIKNDDEYIKLRRQDNIITDFRDFASIRALLEENQLELINFFAPNNGFSKLVRIDGYVLSVVPISKVDNLEKIKIELLK